MRRASTDVLGDSGARHLHRRCSRAGGSGRRSRPAHRAPLGGGVSRAWWTDPGRLLVASSSTPPGAWNAGDTDSRVIAIDAYADPAGHAADVLPRLEAVAASRTFDTESARHLWPGRPRRRRLRRRHDLPHGGRRRLRAEGRLGHLPRMVTLQGIVAPRFSLCRDVAVPPGEEARRLASELDEPFWVARRRERHLHGRRHARRRGGSRAWRRPGWSGSVRRRRPGHRRHRAVRKGVRRAWRRPSDDPYAYAYETVRVDRHRVSPDGGLLACRRPRRCRPQPAQRRRGNGSTRWRTWSVQRRPPGSSCSFGLHARRAAGG